MPHHEIVRTTRCPMLTGQSTLPSACTGTPHSSTPPRGHVPRLELPHDAGSDPETRLGWRGRGDGMRAAVQATASNSTDSAPFSRWPTKTEAPSIRDGGAFGIGALSVTAIASRMSLVPQSWRSRLRAHRSALVGQRRSCTRPALSEGRARPRLPRSPNRHSLP